MQTYFLLGIHDYFYKAYRENTKVLYKTFENLYRMQKKDLNYGVTLYKQICVPFDVAVIIHYFKNRYPNAKIKGNKILLKNVLLTIRPSMIQVTSRYSFPKVLQIFKYYRGKILVIHFENHDCFWLKDLYKTHLIGI